MDVTRRTALWATALQGLFALTWALYVAFLPALLAAAGIDARFAVFFLMFDQAVFALADWAAGLYADRLQRLLGRIGAHLIAAALVSSAALALLPFVARAGDPALLIAATALWTATSSALRAPVFALLGRAGGVLRPAGSVSVALIGIGIANALAPLLTRALAQVDPRLPL
ncbi:MAG TPA: MFS transporter, partial [Burkholderiaceae bacterium]|nr:MFS transporter [Burkholderiaceae bacterium]